MNMPKADSSPSTWPTGSGAASHRQDTQVVLPDWEFDDEFDGGEETCGRVIVNLHLYLRDQQPGLRVLVTSRDPGAPIELPAWCRMTRNELTAMRHPYYLITLKPHLQRR
ncbi:MAG: sulfurtransferase TusA family protein [Desulfopila sp.]